MRYPAKILVRTGDNRGRRRRVTMHRTDAPQAPFGVRPRAMLLVGFAWVAAGSTVANAQQRQPPLWSPPENPEGLLREEMHRPLDEVVSDDIDQLIADLGAPSFPARAHARQRLIDIGPPAFHKLRKAYHQADELEVRLSIEEIVRESYLHFLVYGRNAFLGISQHRFPVTPDKDPRIPEGHVGIQIQQVIEDTAAERAGLRKGDVIIALNGRHVPQTPGVHATVAFGESIRRFGPGMKINLSVLRGQEEVEIPAILGSRPREYYQNQGIVTQMLNFYRKQYDAFWQQHFSAE